MNIPYTSSIALEAVSKGDVHLKEVFDDLFSDLKVDSRFVNAVNKYQVEFINRNQDHLEFFGGNLLGVHIIRFKDTDVNKFYDEVLDLDFTYVKNKVKEVTTINHDFKVAGDAFNLTMIYLIHRSLISEFLVKDKAIRAATDISLIFMYRSICAIHNYYFKYPFDRRVAQEAYRRLSGKFLIKQLGSWHEVLMYRTKALLDTKGVHYPHLTNFKDDDSIVYALADTQGRIKDIIKNYAIELYRVHEEGGSISTTSSTGVDLEGEDTVKDRVGTIDNKIQNLKSIISDKDNFIRADQISIIFNISTNSSPRTMRIVLGWMSDNYQVVKHSKDIDGFISKVVYLTFFFIEKNIPINKRKDIAYVLKSIKDLFLSTRTSDSDIIKVRELGDKISKASIGRASKTLIQSTRTAIILYIALRALTN